MPYSYGKKLPDSSTDLRLLILIFVICLTFASMLYSATIDKIFAKSTETYGNKKISSFGICHEGGPHNILVTRPEYADIGGGVLGYVTGKVTKADVSYGDVPWTHASHDFTWMVKLDPDFIDLNSRGNEREDDGDINETTDTSSDKVMEMENEIGIANNGKADRFPFEFWPSAGDRVWMFGRYIFDCGHPEHGPRTEIHPTEGVASTHFEPLIISSAGSKPILAAKTSIYIHGEPAGRASQTEDVTIGGEIYEFDVTLPPKPSPSSRLVPIVLDTKSSGPKAIVPIITGPFKGLSMRGVDTWHIHVKIDLTSISPSATAFFGSHIAAGWTDPPETNVYHTLKVTFNSVTKLPQISARLATGHRAFEELWVNVNGQYVELLTPNTGFKLHSDPNEKILTPPPSVTTIVAENGLGSKLNIKTTGYLRSPIDDCFGKFRTQDLDGDLDPNPEHVLRGPDQTYLITHPACRDENVNPASLGSVKQNYSIGTISDQTFTFGTHRDTSGFNKVLSSKLLNVSNEFILDYDVKDISGAIVVSSPVTPTPSTPTPSTPTPSTPTPSTPTPSTPTPSTPTPPSTSTCDPNSPTLRIGKDGSVGSRGPKVTELQRDLTTLGYGNLLGPPGIDGKFGPYTKSAVKQFQIDKGLKGKDGVAGPETWAAICAPLKFTNPTGIVKDTKNIYHQIDYVTPANLAGAEGRNIYDPIELAQDNQPFYRQVQSDDFPAIDYEGLANDPTIKNATISPENMTEALPPSENMTEALPPSENMTEALPPSENMTEALPPSEI